MQHETVIVLDFGGQYNQLIARRVRENNVYCEIYSYKTDLSVIKRRTPRVSSSPAAPTASIWKIRPPSTRDLQLGHPCAGNLLRQPADDAPAGRSCLPRP